MQSIFGKVIIPDSVHLETVLEANNENQRKNIIAGIDKNHISVMHPAAHQLFSRNLGPGEIGVLNLADEINPDLLLIDDKKARNEAKRLGFSCAFTSDIFKGGRGPGFDTFV